MSNMVDLANHLLAGKPVIQLRTFRVLIEESEGDAYHMDFQAMDKTDALEQGRYFGKAFSAWELTP
jgi:hypothetical protein